MYGSVWAVCKHETISRRRGRSHQASQLTLPLPRRSQADSTTAERHHVAYREPEDEDEKWLEQMERIEEGEAEEGRASPFSPSNGAASLRSSSSSSIPISSSNASLCNGLTRANDVAAPEHPAAGRQACGEVKKGVGVEDKGVASIFVSTYNYAHLYPGRSDASLEVEGALEAWIPKGHDLYIIGVRGPYLSPMFLQCRVGMIFFDVMWA